MLQVDVLNEWNLSTHTLFFFSFKQRQIVSFSSRTLLVISHYPSSIFFLVYISVYIIQTDWRVCIRLYAFMCAFERVCVRLCAFVRALERVCVRPYVRSCVSPCALLGALVCP